MDIATFGAIISKYKDNIELVNLLNKNTVTNDYFISGGSLIADPSYFVSDYIPTKGNYLYYITKKFVIDYYDSNKNYLSEEGNLGEVPDYNFRTPWNAEFIRISNTKSDLATLSFRVTELMPPYNRLRQIIMSTFGDSVTEQNKFQPHIARMLGFVTTNNYGVGGTRVSGTGTTAMNNDARINAIDASTNVLLFMGGINDWVADVALGTAASSNVSEFYGALNAVATKLTARFPSARIIFMTPTFGTFKSGGWSDANGMINNQGLGLLDYGDAVKVVARKFGFPCIDMYGECGWNLGNVATFVTNDGEYLHPNSYGAERMAQVICGKLRALSPVLATRQ